MIIINKSIKQNRFIKHQLVASESEAFHGGELLLVGCTKTLLFSLPLKAATSSAHSQTSESEFQTASALMQTVNGTQGIVSKFLLEHILLDCPNLHEVRRKYFTASSLKDILVWTTLTIKTTLILLKIRIFIINSNIYYSYLLFTSVLY